MMLSSILDTIDPQVSGLKAIKKSIRKSGRGFIPSSPDSIDSLCFLASCLYIAGDRMPSIKLFEFISSNTDETDSSRRDIVGSLAVARLLLVHIYKQGGFIKKANTILSSENIDASLNITSYDRLKYENIVQDMVTYNNTKFEFFENDEDTSSNDMLRISFNSYCDMVVLTERLPEIENTVSDKDIQQLADALVFSKDKFSFYLLGNSS